MAGKPPAALASASQPAEGFPAVPPCCWGLLPATLAPQPSWEAPTGTGSTWGAQDEPRDLPFNLSLMLYVQFEASLHRLWVSLPAAVPSWFVPVPQADT